MILASVPLTDELWREFIRLHNAQNSPFAETYPRPNQGVWILADGKFCVGLCIYEMDGPYIMAENLVSNPELPLKTRFKGFNLALDLLRGYATSRSKWIIAHPSVKGLGMYLLRRGFKFKQVSTLVAEPGLWQRVDGPDSRSQSRRAESGDQTLGSSPPPTTASSCMPGPPTPSNQDPSLPELCSEELTGR